MKKAILSIHEKHERIVIRYRRKQTRLFALCEDCGKQFEWLTVKEAAELTGNDSKDIIQNLRVLRRNKNENE